MVVKNGKQLRFAALVRVSTEKQEQQGESLRTQRKSVERDVERLVGRIVLWYGGQEHATPGWERSEVDRLVADAGKGMFDALIVAYPDRWSRDNAKSKEGLEEFRKHGIRFYVGAVAKDLHDPNVRLELGIQAEIGEFFALQQHKKSLESKIERAQQGKPSCGDRPFGRLWDRKTQTWSVDPKKQAMVEDVANRLLQGEPLGKLAAGYGVSVSNLWKVLRHRSGDTWQQSFRCKALNIDETVLTTVPRLLDEETIRAVGECLDARRTRLHRPPAPRHVHFQQHTYLLSGHVFCDACGYTMTGQHDDRCGIGYYLHHVAKRYKKSRCECSIQPRPRVRADWLESEVIHQLFTMFGNPSAIEKAIRRAVPDCERLMHRKKQLEADLAKLAKSRDRVLKLVVDDAVTEEHAKGQLSGLREREELIREELGKLFLHLANLPDEDTLRCYVQRIEDACMYPDIFVFDEDGNEHPGGNNAETFRAMTQTDKRRLIEAVFSKPLADGRPAGIYISPDPSGRRGRTRLWNFTIKGQLDFEKVVSTNKDVNKRNVGVPFSPCPPSASPNI